MRSIKILTVSLLALIGVSAAAQKRDTINFPNSYLDTVKVDKVFGINDYFMVGVHGGINFNSMMFNPSYNQEFRFQPGYFGVTVSQYGKMFGSMPYFGYEIGLFYGHEGYKFKTNKETGYTMSIEGATEVDYEVIEMPVLSAFHVDFPNFKILACAGLYGGYRLSINRIGETVYENAKHTFLPTDIRWDYGVQGGAGFGFVFNPFELHFNARVRWSWSPVFQPNAYSAYYYRFATPFDIMAEVGVYYQLTKRSGKDRKAIKKEARDIVYGDK